MSPNLQESLSVAEWRLDDYVLFLRRHFVWIIIWGIAGWGAGVFVVSRIPDSYQAKIRVMVDRYTTEPVGFVESLPALAARRDVEFLATEYQLITSRPVMEQVLNELNLTGFPPFSGANDPTALLVNMIRVTPVRGTKLVDLVVTTTNAKLAMMIANTTADAYAQLNLERRRQQTTGGAQWLRDEVARAEQRMKDAQAALQAFKEEHQMVSLEDRQNVIVQRLKELSSAATEAKKRRVEAEAQQNEVSRALASGASFDQLPMFQFQQEGLTEGVAAATKIKEQLAKAESDLADRQKIYGERHPTILQLVDEIASLRQRLQSESQKVVDSVRLVYELARSREQDLQQALAEQERLALELNRLDLDYQNLVRQAQVGAELYGNLAKRLKELEVAESMQSNNVRVIDSAKLPQGPVAPNRPRFAIQGIVLGAAMGSLLAFLKEALTTTIRMRKDLESLVNLPFLGHVVRVKTVRRGQRGRNTAFFIKNPNSVAAEGVRAIRTTLEFLLPEAPVHRILITSSLPEDGKTFVSVNLSLAIQELGRRVVLIDADMRRPTVYRAFELPVDPGLSAYLEGKAEMEDILRVPPDTKGLTVITSGATPTRPADLLASPRMGQLLDWLSESFQYIMIVTPPILAVADSTVLSRMVEGAILVARANRTTRDVLLAAHRQIIQAPLKFLATVLNDVLPEYDYYYYRRSYSYYSTRGLAKEYRREPPAPMLPKGDAASSG